MHEETRCITFKQIMGKQCGTDERTCVLLPNRIPSHVTRSRFEWFGIVFSGLQNFFTHKERLKLCEKLPSGNLSMRAYFEHFVIIPQNGERGPCALPTGRVKTSSRNEPPQNHHVVFEIISTHVPCVPFTRVAL